MKKVYILLMLAIIAIFAAACGTDGAGDTVGIRGEVTNIAAGQGNTVILVEGSVDKDTMFDKASVTIKPETSVVRMENGSETAAKSEDIKLADTVEVVMDGPVAESYPVQGAAKLVRILSK